MAKSYLDKDGLLYFWQKIKNVFVTDVTYDSTNKKIQKTKAGSTSDVVTLSTVATSGSYNDLSNKPTIPTLKNVFGKVKVGSTTVEADTTQDTLELAAGDGISLTPDATNDKVTIAGTLATGSAPGMLSSSDFTKLSGIATGAEVNQNAFSNVKVGSTTVAADAKTDTLELAAGTNITLTPDATNDKVTIATSAEVNQNAFSNVKVGSTTVAADSKTDTLELAAGTAITLTPDATNDKVTIAAKTMTAATASANGAVGCVPTPPMSTTGELYSGYPVLTSAGWGKASLTWGISDVLSSDSYTFLGLTITSNDDPTRSLLTAELKGSDLADHVLPNATSTAYGVVKLDSSIASSAQANPVTGGAIYTALSGKINTSARGAANGVCPLNANTKIDATYLPSYVDDVIEVYARSGQTALSQNWFATGSASGTVVTPEAGKIYVLMADSGDYAANTQFRWGGSAYVKMADGGVSSITNAEIDTIVAA